MNENIEKVLAVLVRMSDEMTYSAYSVLYDEISLLDDLLKAQQPRVMALDEVIAHYSLPPVFPDDFNMQEDYLNDIEPLYFDFPNDTDPWIVHWRCYNQVATHLNDWKASYGENWRCWTSRPDEKVRAETPWQK